ncbi:MAG: ECF-type sigma factor [Planctomycetota bacterium]
MHRDSTTRTQPEPATFEDAYARLRAIAGAAMARERAEHTLQATALVHEAYVKLSQQADAVYKDREHFLAVAATAMRRLLIDHARAHDADKRGGGEPKRLLIEDVCGVCSGDPIAVLELEDALVELERVSTDQARVVELKFFGGLTNAEVARTVETTERTIERRWRAARAWLFDRLVVATDQQRDQEHDREHNRGAPS